MTIKHPQWRWIMYLLILTTKTLTASETHTQEVSQPNKQQETESQKSNRKIKKWSQAVINDTQKWNNKVAYLHEMITENEGLELEPDTQRVFFESLYKIYTDRIQNYQEGMGEKTDLSELKQTFIDAGTSTFISSADKKTIKACLETVLLEEKLFTSGNEATYQQQLDSLESLIDQSKDHAYDKFIQTTFFNKTCKLLNPKKLDEYRNDPKTLESTLKTLEKSLKTPLLTKQQQRYLEKNIYIPQQIIHHNCIVQAEIKEILTCKRYEDKLIGLHALSKNPSKLTISGETQNQFMDALQSVYDHRNDTNEHQLLELKQLCKSAHTSPLLSPTHKKEIMSKFSPHLSTTIENISLQNNISFASLQPVHADSMKELKEVFKKIGTTALTEQTTSMLNKACINLFEKREDDESSLNQLKKFYESINHNKHLTSLCKTTIEKEFLPSLTAELDNKAFYNDVIKLPAESGHERMNSFHKLITDYRAKPLNKKNEELLAATLDTFFTHRNQKKRDLEILYDFFLKIKENPLFSQKEQTTIMTKYLPALKRDKNDLELSENLSNSIDFYQIDERIDAVTAVVQKTYDKSYNSISLDLLSTVVNDLVDQRIENTSTLTKLNKLLNATHRSSALSPEQKKHVQNKLLPMITQDLDILQLKRASSLPEYHEKITELTNYCNKSNEPFSERINDVYSEALHSAFDQRPYENLAELKKFHALLEKSQKRLRENSYKKKITQQLLPLINKDINSLSFKHELQAAMAQKSMRDKLKAFPEIIQRYTDTSLMESSKKLLSENLQSLFDQRSMAMTKQEINEKMKITKNMLQLFKETYSKNILNGPDNQHLVKNLIPVLSHEEIGLSIQAKIQHIAQSSTKSKIIEGLKSLIDETKDVTYNAETQDCYAHHIQQLTQQAKNLDHQTLQELQILLDHTQDSTLLSPSQSHFVMTKLKPTVSSIVIQHELNRIAQNESTQQIADLNQLIKKYTNVIVLPEAQDAYAQLLQNINRKAESLDPLSVEQLNQLLNASTETSMLTPTQQTYVQNTMIPVMKATTIPQHIQLIKNNYPIDTQIDELYCITQNAAGRSYPAPTKNAFGSTLVELAQSCKELNFTTHAKLERLLHAASKSPLLTQAQQLFFETKILPSVTLAPTPQTIHHIMTIESTKDQLASLRKVVQAARSGCCPNTQNAFGGTLVQLSRMAEQLQSDDRNNLIDLIKISTTSPLLSFAQQQYFRKTVLPQVIQEATPPSIHRIMSESSIDNQILSLTELIKYSKNKEYDSATKNTFGSSLVQLSQQAENLPFPTRAHLQRLVLKSTKTPLLTDAQQNFFKETILPTVVVRITPTSINELLHHGTITDQIAWLKSLLELPTQDAYNAQIKNSFGKSLAQLANRNADMNQQTRNKFLHLLVKASNSTLLSERQQEYVKNTMVPLIYKETTNGLMID